jgi:outer membrane protein OmpA-like peptidoglycan-associated protein
MTPRVFFTATAMAAVLLGACATTEADRPPFDPAACYEREFNVYFEGQSTQISPAAREVIAAMGDTLHGCRIDRVRIVGAADAFGGDISNEEVSEIRAQVLADYLARRIGWPRSRMEVAAAGERGAVTQEGLNVPMRRRAQITVTASAP